MTSYVHIDQKEGQSPCGFIYCIRHTASSYCTWLTRARLITVVVVSLLLVTLIWAKCASDNISPALTESNDFKRSSSKYQSSLHHSIDGQPVVHKPNTTEQSFLAEDDQHKQYDYDTYNPQAVRISSGLRNSSKQEAVDSTVSCPAAAIAQITRPVFDDESAVVRLPQCLIIGVRKGGTRALLEFLNLHPDVQAVRQEVHFFDIDSHYRRGLQWYRRQMRPVAAGQVLLEKTPAYFVESNVAERIYHMNSSIRLLVTFRDPVERAISDYLQIHEQRVAKGKTHPTFEELVINPTTGDIDHKYQAVSRSLYAVHLKRWLRYFSVDQFHFLSAEDLVSNPAAELQKVEKFLGVRHLLTKDLFYFNESRGFYCMCVDQRKREAKPDKQVSIEGKCLSSSKGRTHPTIDPQVISKLKEFFRPYNKLLYEITKINFGW